MGAAGPRSQNGDTLVPLVGTSPSRGGCPGEVQAPGAWSTPGWGRHQGHREWDHWEHPAGGADTRRPQKSREAESSHQARLFCQGLIRLVTGREEPARFPPLIPPESFLSAVPALKKKAVKMTALGCLAQKGSFPRIQPGPKSPVLVEAEGRGASWLTQTSS